MRRRSFGASERIWAPFRPSAIAVELVDLWSPLAMVVVSSVLRRRRQKLVCSQIGGGNSSSQVSPYKFVEDSLDLIPFFIPTRRYSVEPSGKCRSIYLLYSTAVSASTKCVFTNSSHSQTTARSSKVYLGVETTNRHSVRKSDRPVLLP
jgi:hypothetical protein